MSAERKGMVLGLMEEGYLPTDENVCTYYDPDTDQYIFNATGKPATISFKDGYVAQTRADAVEHNQLLMED